MNSEKTKEQCIAEMNARRERRIAKRKQQERLIEEGVLCGFSLTYHGACAQVAVPHTGRKDARCDEHKDIMCTNCGNRASHECDYIGMLVCGFPLCKDCSHPHRKRVK